MKSRQTRKPAGRDRSAGVVWQLDRLFNDIGQTCPRCLKELPKKWRESEDGVYTHDCGARMRPLLSKKWPQVVGVLITLACPILLGLAGYHGLDKSLGAFVIGAVFGFVVSEYASRPVLVPASEQARGAKAR